MKLPRINGWDVRLRCEARGWIRFYLCGGSVDLDGYEIEDWMHSFRIRDISSGTWRTISFENGDVRVRIIWESRALEELLEGYVQRGD